MNCETISESFVANTIDGSKYSVEGYASPKSIRSK